MRPFLSCRIVPDYRASFSVLQPFQTRDESSLKGLVGTRDVINIAEIFPLRLDTSSLNIFPISHFIRRFFVALIPGAVAAAAECNIRSFLPIHSFENSLLLIQRSFTSFESCHNDRLRVSQLWSNDKFYFCHSRGARFPPHSSYEL